MQIGKAGVFFARKFFVVLLQINVSHEASSGVGLSFMIVTSFYVPLLFAKIPFAIFFPDHTHVSAFHRLPKQIVGLYFDVRILLREIIGAIRFYAHRKVWQIVAADLDRLVAL